MKEPIACTVCHEPYPLEHLVEFQGELCCPSCLGVETVFCVHCGAQIWRENNSGDDDTPLCQSCYDDYYYSCSHCGRLIHHNSTYFAADDDDEPYCHDCYVRYCESHSIHEYFYKPEPHFYGNSGRYFGVELEIDEGGESDSRADCVLDVANCNGLEHVYCKHDGSLDDGFEIVTHPMTLEYHTNEMPWQHVLDTVRSMGYLSHRAATCGLHVHVNRESLGATESARDACIARILFFVEKHWDELLKFSRRSRRQLERWAARYGYKDQPLEILNHAKKNTNYTRYSCINLQNLATIEFRIFRGTLKYNTLIATLQLVDRVCDVALFMSDEEIKELSWTSFVAGCNQPELVQYLKERQLYINEPVAAEEEM